MLSDSLTGFCNRIGFEEQVDAALAVPLGRAIIMRGLCLKMRLMPFWPLTWRSRPAEVPIRTGGPKSGNP
ncbi:MAG: hypothetical protein RL251_862, partial [Pseudomonadota bacterium]